MKEQQDERRRKAAEAEWMNGTRCICCPEAESQEATKKQEKGNAPWEKRGETEMFDKRSEQLQEKQHLIHRYEETPLKREEWR